MDYLQKNGYEIRTEYGCSIIPINPLTKNPLPYDVEVVDCNLIIEVHGRQHYEEQGETSKWLHGLTSAEYLTKRKEYDEFKKSYALAEGFFYLEIPYWAEEEDEFTILIDKKIAEIKTYNMRTTTERESVATNNDVTV